MSPLAMSTQHAALTNDVQRKSTFKRKLYNTILVQKDVTKYKKRARKFVSTDVCSAKLPQPDIITVIKETKPLLRQEGRVMRDTPVRGFLRDTSNC